MSEPVIAVGFDGVIHKYSKGWYDGTIYDEPIEGCKEALQKLSKTYRIIIFSTRGYDREVNGEQQSNQAKEMAHWLNLHGIHYDRIHTEPTKPICKLLIDDNAYRFSGDWEQCLDDVDRFFTEE